jgi:DNA polymerase (family 10)
MNKTAIADVLTHIATLLELTGENPFKIRAYSSGARQLQALEQSELETLLREERLQSVKGIGAALAQQIGELHATGRSALLEQLQASIAPGLVEMLEVPGLGPKKVKAIHDQLGITTLAELTAACTDGRVAELAGFGAKTQMKILAGIRNREAYGKRHLWWEAHQVAEPIIAGLRALPQVSQAEAAGSLRRCMETVGDLDFIVAATDVAPVVEWFVTQPGVQEITARGDTKASVRFDTGLQADLRLVPFEQFAFALHHFTGSKDHNVQMRQRALSIGFSLSEWGLVLSTGEGTTKEKAAAESLPAASESALFTALGLAYIPPELREGRGEIEAAEADALPHLIELDDLRGAFHNHTTASDGNNTLEEMTAAADALGWSYLGIADHSPSSVQARGLSEARLAEQVAAIHALNATGRYRTHVFTGTECDILPDGRLDFDDGVLATLDYVVASVHSAFTQSQDDMTARIIRAIEHPRTTMLGHLTGRLLLRRESYALDVEKIIDAAIANHVAIELNANPWRLDMDWRHWRKASARGLLCAINPDAHDTAGLEFVATGINAARKGWLTKNAVLNTRPLAAVQSWLAHRRSGGHGHVPPPKPTHG